MAYIRPPNTVLAGKALKQTPLPSPTSPAGALSLTLDVEIATKTSLGVVQIGDNIDVTPEGVISVASSGSGPTGPIGPTGPAGSSEACVTRTITGDYSATLTDYYMGASLTDAATVTLPLNPPDCVEYVIKLQYGAPVGTRKLTVAATSPNLIDGAPSIVFTTPYQCVSLISNEGNWYIT